MAVRTRMVWAVAILVVSSCSLAGAADGEYLVGAAKVEITPTHPVILAGYGSRTAEHEGIDTPLWARALAIGDREPVLLLAVENCGVPAGVVEEVAGRLAKTGLTRSRLVLAATHTHSAPSLVGYAAVLWGGRATAEQNAHAARYTAWLTGKLVDVASQALGNRRPARLAWGQGRVRFGGNRRMLEDGKWTGFGHAVDGPVDHSLPLLVARDNDGKLIATWTTYACHCTTVGARNRIGGDWAGFASQNVEDTYAGAVALTTIGCGADVGPQPTGSLELAQEHGRAVAAEVSRLIAGTLTPLSRPVAAEQRQVALPMAALPTKEHWERQAARGGFDGYHATLMLQRLAREGSLPKAVVCPLTTWRFGDELAVVFLAGEVVVDYAVRLKRELDWTRLWINAWSNDVPCYVPSRRLLAEGGYETDFSMIYYVQPTRFDPAVEDVLVSAVKQQLGEGFARRPSLVPKLQLGNANPADVPEPDFLRPPDPSEVFARRVADAARQLRGDEQRAIVREVRALGPLSHEGFARVLHKDGGEDAWYDFSGAQRKRPFLRQLTPGATLGWETPPVSAPAGGDSPAEAVFVFLGGLGWESQPKTDGFVLLVGGQEAVAFDVTRQARQWRSADGAVRLVYLPTWTSSEDSGGFFYVRVARTRLTAGKPCTLAVRSRGSGSKRWFSLDPIGDVKRFEASLLSALPSP